MNELIEIIALVPTTRFILTILPSFGTRHSSHIQENYHTTDIAAVNCNINVLVMMKYSLGL